LVDWQIIARGALMYGPPLRVDHLFNNFQILYGVDLGRPKIFFVEFWSVAGEGVRIQNPESRRQELQESDHLSGSK
jgi:hypothetical protein